jgi:hypothetical protein
MSIDLSQINVWAVLVAAIAAFLVGGVWYGALFAKPWVVLNKHSEQAVAEMQKKQGRNLAVFFVAELVIAAMLAVLVANLGIATALGGLALGLLLWLGDRATIGLSRNVANDKPTGAFLIDTGYDLASVTVMSVIIGAWR